MSDSTYLQSSMVTYIVDKRQKALSLSLLKGHMAWYLNLWN